MNGETTMSSQTARSSMRRRAALAFGAMVAALTVSAANAALTPVYRFFHLDAGRHFYTASETEKVKVQTTYPRFAYEGVAFYAYSTQDAGTIPVYRATISKSVSKASGSTKFPSTPPTMIGSPGCRSKR